MGSDSCTICPKGAIIDAYKTSFIQSLPGYYSNKEGAIVLTKCPEGTHSDNIWSISCSSCPEGSIPNSLQTSYYKCPPGYYAILLNA